MSHSDRSFFRLGFWTLRWSEGCRCTFVQHRCSCLTWLCCRPDVRTSWRSCPLSMLERGLVRPRLFGRSSYGRLVGGCPKEHLLSGRCGSWFPRARTRDVPQVPRQHLPNDLRRLRTLRNRILDSDFSFSAAHFTWSHEVSACAIAVGAVDDHARGLSGFWFASVMSLDMRLFRGHSTLMNCLSVISAFCRCSGSVNLR